MNTLTKKEIFKASHVIARECKASIGNYSVALKMAMSVIYKGVKAGYSVGAIVTGTILKWAGATTAAIGERTTMKAISLELAKRYIKENGANAGKVWEEKGMFYFYVYNK